MNKRMEKTVPESATGAVGWGTEGIHQPPLASPASREGSLWGSAPPGFTAQQSSCNFVFNFAVRNITLYLFIHPLMLRGSAAAVSGRDASPPISSGRSGGQGRAAGACSAGTALGTPGAGAWLPPSLNCFADAPCPLARAAVTAPSVRGPALPQPAAPAPAVMASSSPTPREASAHASPAPAHRRSAPVPQGGKHGTVQVRQSSGTAEPPRTPSHTDRARAARAARAQEPGQGARGQHLLRGDRDTRTTVAACFSAQVH